MIKDNPIQEETSTTESRTRSLKLNKASSLERNDMKKVQREKLYNIKPSYLDTIVNTIGRKRALLILIQLGKHKKLRYSELPKKLGGISPSTLSSILKQLNKEGLIEKKVFGNIIPRATEYSLTKKGLDLLNAIDPLLRWVCQQR